MGICLSASATSRKASAQTCACRNNARWHAAIFATRSMTGVRDMAHQHLAIRRASWAHQKHKQRSGGTSYRAYRHRVLTHRRTCVIMAQTTRQNLAYARCKSRAKINNCIFARQQDVKHAAVAQASAAHARRTSTRASRTHIFAARGGTWFSACTALISCVAHQARAYHRGTPALNMRAARNRARGEQRAGHARMGGRYRDAALHSIEDAHWHIGAVLYLASGIDAYQTCASGNARIAASGAASRIALLRRRADAVRHIDDAGDTAGGYR